MTKKEIINVFKFTPKLMINDKEDKIVLMCGEKGGVGTGYVVWREGDEAQPLGFRSNNWNYASFADVELAK